MDAQAAARLGDEIAHGFGVAAMVAGAVAGALIGAAAIAATVATGGVAVAIFAGSIAAGGLSMFQIVKGLSTIFNLPEPTTGKLQMGSFNVYINGFNAMRAGEDVASSCSGLPMNHPIWPFPVLIAEGSATVFINGKPAARLHSKMVCGAHIKSGSPNTFIGGPTVSVAFVLDIEGWMHTGLEALGLLAMGGAAILAAMAGLAALAGFVVIGGTMMAGMALLGDMGDRLGPGYRDLLQGVAGLVLLGLGPKIAKIGAAPESVAPNKSLPFSGGTPTLEGAAANPDVVNLRSAEFYRLYGDNPLRGTKSNLEARQWYLAEDAKILNRIDTFAPLEVQARQAFEMRNANRTQAREFMSDRISADRLTREEPNMTWPQMIDYRKSQGLSGDEIYQSILESSQRTRVEVNKRLGVE
ncbi:PAAR domain-containing protein [Pseudomonas sp. B21-015]|uniref:PAAR domain-containing protein n=1 Tax=Pseudomonas sp. B21-015 TaxID=2895473 RepID=UPI002852E4A8|nr:PAAR domain-containing protein [Pseudomonas sp. B21-015]